MPDDEQPVYWYLEDIARELGFTVSAVKKWRGAFIRAKKAGRPPGRNALPAPDNDREVTEQGARPRWRPDVIDRWAKRTERRDPETGETTWPSPPGRPPESERQRR